MSDFASQVQRPSSGCGIQGCLFAAVAIFALLMIGLLVIAFFRFQEPPQGVRMPGGIIGYPLSAVVDPEAAAERRRPTPGRVQEEAAERHA